MAKRTPGLGLVLGVAAALLAAAGARGAPWRLAVSADTRGAGADMQAGPSSGAELSFSNTIAQTTAMITNLMAQRGVPALSIALVHGGRTVWIEGFGMADRERGIPAGPDTIYRIASLSKAFAGLTVMTLAEEGRLALEDPVTNTIPAFSLLPRYAGAAPVTIRSLLAHQSGIPGVYLKNAVTTSQREDYYATVLALLAEDYPNFPPGFMEQYNNNGITLMDGVVSGASGQDYRTYAFERVLRPMGLSNTVFLLAGDQTNRLARLYRDGKRLPDEYVNTFASGGKYSTVRDLGRWIAFLIGYGELDGTRVLASNSVAAVWTDQSDRATLRTYEQYQHCGLGWDQVADPEFTYAGQACWKYGGSEGYGSLVLVIPGHALGVAVLNTISGDIVAQPVARLALRSALEEAYGLTGPTNTPLLPVTPVVPMQPGALAAITGHYASAASYDLLSEENGSLTWARRVESDSPTTCSGLVLHEDGWFYPATGQPAFQLSFTNAGGRVFMKQRAPAGTYIETSILWERFVPALLGQAWQHRTNTLWIADFHSPDSYFLATGGRPFLSLSIHDGVLMVVSLCGSAVLQPQSDDLAFAFAVGNSSVYALQVRRVNGRECLRYGGFDFYPYHTPGAFAGRGTDLAVYAPSIGNWYAQALGGDLALWANAWGGAGMTPVPGDYDGDGLCDLAVYDRGAGLWYIASLAEPASLDESSNQESRINAPRVLAWAEAWGGPGLDPVMGDYDGDGRWDLAVYDAAVGRWYIRTLAGTVLAWDIAFGYPGAQPVPGDYDADCAWDLVVCGKATGLWHGCSLEAGTLFWAEAWGGPGFDPVMGDYDGDGRWDLAVHDAAAGRWYIRTLAGTVLAWDLAFGYPGARPVPGDYDGDQAWDLAVYGAAAGQWHIQSLANGVLAWDRAWGGPGLTPAMNPQSPLP